MDDQKKTEKAANEIKEEQPEKIFPGEVVPENEWHERQRYMREVVNPDNT